MENTEAIELLENGAMHEDEIDFADRLYVARKMAVETLKLIPDNSTNGEMIQALFPNGAVAVMSYPSNKIGFITRDGNPDDNYVWYPTSWWNAPYQKGDK